MSGEGDPSRVTYVTYKDTSHNFRRITGLRLSTFCISEKNKISSFQCPKMASSITFPFLYPVFQILNGSSRMQRLISIQKKKKECKD